MPKVDPKIQKAKLQEFITYCMHNGLDARYPNVTIDNRTWDIPPIIDISHVNKNRQRVLCKVTYGDYGKMEYSLNWYVNDRMAVTEVNSGDKQEISNHLLRDAETFFEGAGAPLHDHEWHDEAWGNDFGEWSFENEVQIPGKDTADTASV